MKHAARFACTLVALLACAAAPATDDAEIARLIQRLGDDSYAEREAAGKALEKAGEAALPALRRALRSDDAEVRRRAEELIAAILRRPREEAIAALERIGTKILREETDPKRPVVKVDLSGSKAAGGALTHIRRLPELRILDLGGAAVSDEQLSGLESLTELRLLRLNGTAVTDAGLVRLKGLKALKLLNLEETAVTAKGVAALKQALPDLGVVD